MKPTRLTKGSLAIVARGLSQNHGVTVGIGGERAYTTGSHIQLPALSDDDAKALIMSRGYLDHEVGHVLFTNFGPERPSGFGRHIYQIIEDVRQERLMGGKYPGSRVNIQELVTLLASEDKPGSFFNAAGPDDKPGYCLRAYLLQQARTRYGQQHSLEQALSATRASMQALFGGQMLDEIDKQLARIPDLTCTSDSIALAYDIIGLLQQNAQEQPPPEDSDHEGEDGDEGEQGETSSEASSGDGSGDDGSSETSSDSGDDNNSSDDDNGESSSSDDAPDEGTPSEGSDTGRTVEDTDDESGDGNTSGEDSSSGEASADEGSGNGSSQSSDDSGEDNATDNPDTGTGQSGGESTDDSSQTDESNGNDQGETDDSGHSEGDFGDDPASDPTATPQQGGDQPNAHDGEVGDGNPEQIRQAIQQALDNRDIDGDSDLGSIVARELEERSDDSDDAIDTVFTPGKEGGSEGAEHVRLHPVDASKAQRATTQLQVKLASLLEAERRVRKRHKQTGVKLDISRLPQIKRPNPSVFQRKNRRRDISTAVHLLVDRSSSMRDMQQTAGQATLAIMTALDRIKDVTRACSAFPGVGKSPVVPITKAEQTMTQTRSKYIPAASGGTPALQAMWWVAADLMSQRVDRRIMLMVTDGMPAPRTYDSCVASIRRMRSMGIECLGIGIGVDTCGLFGIDQAITIHSVNELAPELFRVMRGLLSQAA